MKRLEDIIAEDKERAQKYYDVHPSQINPVDKYGNKGNICAVCEKRWAVTFDGLCSKCNAKESSVPVPVKELHNPCKDVVTKREVGISPLDTQVAGSHYKDMKIQPIEFIQANQLNYCEAGVIKYVCRHRNKNGAEDVRKAIHLLELLLELEYKED